MKPKTAEVYFIYQCNKCGQEHQASIKETKFPGGVLCYCGNKIKFDPIKHVHLNIEYQNKPTQGVDKPAKRVYNGPVRAFRTPVISSLVNLGYKRKQVEEVYANILDTIPDKSDDEDIIKRLLQTL